MTIEELRAIVSALKVTIGTLGEKVSDLNTLINSVDGMIAASNPLSSAVDPDQIVAIYSPLYISKLTEIETVTDTLGTDPLH